MRYHVTNKSKIDWVHHVCKQAAGGHEGSRSIPFETLVSMTHETQLDPDSVASFKADGTRFYMVLTVHDGRNIACLVDRYGEVWTIEVDASVDMFAMGMGSVFDGEWCKYLSASSHALFLVFNTLMDRGLPFFDRPYRSRLAAVTRNFPQTVLTTIESKQSLGFVQSRNPSLHILSKPYFPASEMSQQARVGSTMFPSDGFVITPLGSRMTTGRNYNLLKHKTIQTVDLLSVCDAADVHLFAMDQGVVVPATSVISCYLPDDPELQKVIRGHILYHHLVNPDTPASSFEHIVEYLMYPEHDTGSVRLRYMRIRTDKDRANDIVTVRGTVDSAVCGITVDSIADRITDLQKHGRPC